MGRLIDIDSVLAIPMSKRAREKVITLPSKPAIVFKSAERSWFKDETHKGHHECHTLACILLMAYRYGVNRHTTQALYRLDEAEVILQNLDLMPDDFIRQMICGIHNEYYMWENANEEDKKKYFLDSPYYLQPMLDKLQEEYEKRVGRRIPMEDRW